ncbi:hypothetical protein NQ028_06585 [Corynebacterium phoceense]|uniref:VG15 protein n=1 Tax=Corynebacterium phoceense TaxID=1686286 RepID=UPI00211B8BE9|nr:hypothetical protein [Corynebacterium phoceense]MCQ9340812.1 hypothetical protein [Corynebacterium phoceense]
MALTYDRVNEYRALIDEIVRLAQQDLVAAWRVAESLGSNQDFWDYLTAAVPEIAAQYRPLMAENAALFYEETQGLTFSTESIATAGAVSADQIRSSTEWALVNGKGNQALDLMAGSLQRALYDGGRTYAMDGFGEKRQRWVRAASAGACEFCRMLATRSVRNHGAYSSAAAAANVGHGKRSKRGTREVDSSFHDHCHCVPVLYDEYEIPDFLDGWDAQYEQAARNVGSRSDFKAILAEMRQLNKESAHTH